MSYCRFSEGDVYVYMDVGGYLSCCGCRLGKDVPYRSTRAMVAHLAEHVAAGHDVPGHVVPEMWVDDFDNFPAEVTP